MKKTKLEKGITLIALIITIEVLLILAIVTIGAVQESKIIGHSKKAANDYKIAGEKESIALGYSEYIIEKNISKDATLKVEGAQVTGSEKSGFKVVFNETNSTYEVDKDGNITYVEAGEEGEDDTDIVIAAEKDLAIANYIYNTMYNPNQPEIVCPHIYYDDENNDKISDLNSSLAPYIGDSYFNIPVAFFSKKVPTSGNINAKITNFDGTEEEIILMTTDNKVWTYNATEVPAILIPNGYDSFTIELRSNTQYDWESGKYEESMNYHFLSIDGEVAIPFSKLTILEETLEFPYNCQGMIACGDLMNNKIEPLYTDINKVSRIIVNFSNDTKKIYKKNNFFDMNLYLGTDGYPYSSQDVPILYKGGIFYINMPEASLKTQITSVIVEENGVATKYNVSDSTMVTHTRPGS